MLTRENTRFLYSMTYEKNGFKLKSFLNDFDLSRDFIIIYLVKRDIQHMCLMKIHLHAVEYCTQLVMSQFLLSGSIRPGQ